MHLTVFWYRGQSFNRIVNAFLLPKTHVTLSKRRSISRQRHTVSICRCTTNPEHKNTRNLFRVHSMKEETQGFQSLSRPSSLYVAMRFWWGWWVMPITSFSWTYVRWTQKYLLFKELLSLGIFYFYLIYFLIFYLNKSI